MGGEQCESARSGRNWVARNGYSRELCRQDYHHSLTARTATARPPYVHFEAASVFRQPPVSVEVQHEGEVPLSVSVLHAGPGAVAVGVGLVVAPDWVPARQDHKERGQGTRERVMRHRCGERESETRTRVWLSEWVL